MSSESVHPVWCVHEPPYCPTVAECHMRRRSDPVGSAAGSARPISAREAARRRLRLDGADAQALEHALTITERERDALRADLAEAEAHHVEHHERENARGVAAIVAYVRSYESVREDGTTIYGPYQDAADMIADGIEARFGATPEKKT